MIALPRSRNTMCKLTCIPLLILSACSGDPDPGPADTGVEPVDSGPPIDGGVRDFCPALAMPACTKALDCGPESMVPSCPTCPTFNSAVCLFGACATPERHMAGDPRNIDVPASNFAARIQGVLVVTLLAETSGGKMLTCADVTDARVDLTTGCYNVVDVRKPNLVRMGDIFKVFSNQYPAEMPVIFLVYAFDNADLTGDPFAVSCTEYPGGAVGSGAVTLSGGEMTSL